MANKRAATERLVEATRRSAQLEAQILAQASKISACEHALNISRSSKHRLASFLVTPIGPTLREAQVQKQEQAKEVPNAIGPIGVRAREEEHALYFLPKKLTGRQEDALDDQVRLRDGVVGLGWDACR